MSQKTPNISYPDERCYDSMVRNGAATLPTEVIHYLDLKEGSPLFFAVDTALGVVKLQKSPLCCALCGRGGELGIANGFFLCRTCVETLLAHPPTSYYP